MQNIFYIKEVRNEKPVLSGVEGNLGVYPKRSRRSCTLQKTFGEIQGFFYA
tara:strand:- start:22941 stop:23093 length:153 start_codon:yes stop_codon:yes gene_type:complete